MASDCRRPACSVDCVGPTSERLGLMRRIGRSLAVVTAVMAGAGFVLLCTLVAGHGRVRRGTWAMHRISRWILRAMGVRWSVSGSVRSGPSLVVGNHVSFLDVLLLSASAPLRMVAKHEVADWPLIGGVAARTGTMFLQRRRLRTLPDTVADIADALRAGYRVQVFPEGTTRCGTALDPFRRAAFQAALDAAVVVSPVTVTYRQSNGEVATAAAFVGADTLVASIRRVIATPDLTATLNWLPAIPAIPGTGRPAVDRKAVARLAENAVARNLDIPIMRKVRTRPAPSPRRSSTARGPLLRP